MFLASCATDKNFKRGEKYFALGEYYDAATEYKKAYGNTSPKEKDKRGDRARRMAYCYERSLQTPKAIAAYKNAIRYNQIDAVERLAYARLLLKNGEYKYAREEFEGLRDSLVVSDWKSAFSGRTYSVSQAEQLIENGLQSALTAANLKAEGSRYTVKKQDLFNSRRADFCPMLMGDQYEYLYFTSSRNEAEGDELSGITGTKPFDIFFSQKDEEGKWQSRSRCKGV